MSDNAPHITELIECAKKVKTHSKFGADMDMDYINMLLTKICGAIEIGMDMRRKFIEREAERQISHKETILLHETAINAIMDESKDALRERDEAFMTLQKEFNDRVKTQADQHKVEIERNMKICETKDKLSEGYKKQITQLAREIGELKRSVAFGCIEQKEEEIDKLKREHGADKKLIEKLRKDLSRAKDKKKDIRTIEDFDNILFEDEDGDTYSLQKVMDENERLITENNELNEKLTEKLKEQVAEQQEWNKKHDALVKQFDEWKVERREMSRLKTENACFMKELEDIRKKKLTQCKMDTSIGGDSEALKRTIQTMTRDHATKIAELKKIIRSLKPPASSTQHLPSVKYDKLLNEHKALNKKYDALKSRCGDAKADITALRQIEHLRNELKQRDERIKELRTACILGEDC